MSVDELVDRLAGIFWKAANPEHGHLWDVDGSWPTEYDRTIMRQHVNDTLAAIEASGWAVVPRECTPARKSAVGHVTLPVPSPKEGGYHSCLGAPDGSR